MATKALADELDREHREIDDGITAFADGVAAGYGDTEPLVRAISALRRHIWLEEEFLFPPLMGAGLVAPVFVMLREHAGIWQTLDEIDERIGKGQAADAATVALCRRLTVQLQHHNPKEERILYPEADRLMTESAHAELEYLVGSGEMPGDWVCIRAR